MFNPLNLISKFIKSSNQKELDRIAKIVDKKNGTYGYAQGTSMATPIVSGSAALIKALNPKLSASDIRQVILKGIFHKILYTQKIQSKMGKINHTDNCSEIS